MHYGYCAGNADFEDSYRNDFSEDGKVRILEVWNSDVKITRNTADEYDEHVGEGDFIEFAQNNFDEGVDDED